MAIHKSEQSAKPVGAGRVLAVLIELGKHPSGITLDELTSILHDTKSTIHRALSTLQRSGLAIKTDRGIYCLGDEFLRIANDFQRDRPEVVHLEPAMRDIATKFGETVHYAVLENDEVIYRAKIDAPTGPVKLSSVIGGRNPAYCTAVGKLLLSYRYETYEEFSDWLSGVDLVKRTHKTIINPRQLWNAVVASKSQGFATDDQENEQGINCLALPVFARGLNVPTGAISVSGLAFRSPIETLVANRQEIAKILSGAL